MAKSEEIKLAIRRFEANIEPDPRHASFGRDAVGIFVKVKIEKEIGCLKS